MIVPYKQIPESELLAHYQALWDVGLIVPPEDPKSRSAHLILPKCVGKVIKELADPRDERE